MEAEWVFGGGAIRFLYKTFLGYYFAILLSRLKLFSKLYGFLKSHPWSRLKIENFIKEAKIDLNEYEDKDYESFNDFFIRRFKEGRRKFAEGQAFPAFAEGRYLCFNEFKKELRVPVKGLELDLKTLVGSECEEQFSGGPVAVARLCPVDYHRFHYPDNGEQGDRLLNHGPLHSVNPVAFQKFPKLLQENERQLTFLHTEHFGTLAYIEVGALCVGRIEQWHKKGYSFKRGEEKGAFLFGGSSVILLGEPGAFKWDNDLCERSREGIESLILLGEPIGHV